MQPSTAEPSALSAPALIRRGLAGVFLSGLLLAFLGAILPAWGYHLSSDYALVGTFFLAMNAGFLIAVKSANGMLRRLGIRLSLILATALAAIGFGALIFVAPPAPAAWCQAVLPILGFAAGLLNATVFELITPAYERAPSATLNLAGILFVAGAASATLIVAAAIETQSLWIPLACFAAISFTCLVWFVKRTPRNSPIISRARGENPVNLAAILSALVFFFQFGSEWAIAGWLPLFLIQRLGISPQAALLFLALYWLALLVGRVMIQAILPRFRHFRILMASIISALLGCTILAATNNRFGATMALLFIGGGFAAIYPLLVEVTGARFKSYHPIYFNGVFSLGLLGGLLAPTLAGFISHEAGLSLAMLIPLICTLLVFILLLLIRVEAKLNPIE